MSPATAILIGTMLGCVFGCSVSTDPSVQMGTAEFHIADAPSDDESVRSVFVTVTDVRVEGSPIPDFVPLTIDLAALKEGKTQVLGTSTFIATAFKTVTLVINTNVDAAGQTPGAYVQTFDDAKYKLKDGGTMEITIEKRWSVPPNAKVSVVVDVDLRKAIKESADPAVRYAFVSDANLGSAFRITTKEESSTISGTYAEQVASGADKVIVYAYKNGTFDLTTESQPQTEDAIFFRNAVTSAAVPNTGSVNFYSLFFIEPGDYQLFFAAYKRDAASGKLLFQGVLKSTTVFQAAASDYITVQAGIPAMVATTITGI
ncbi:MAG TPA: DUF4382 domain-containing protein [Cyclobacteriaceae bacterium]|nr:DUF4382 domain-containing protein [Cyclobacteriaceae bacterium]